MPDSLLDLPVRDLLDAVADHTPAPGGGAVAALATAFAAALTGMVARYAPEPGDRAQLADDLRTRVVPLVDADATAYQDYLAALRLPRADESRPAALERTLDVASAVPAEVAEVAALVANLADGLVDDGNPNLRGDAAAAVQLAAAAAAIAAELVVANARPGVVSPRQRRAVELAGATRALATGAQV